MRRRRAHHLLATAALATALSSIVVASPAGNPLDTVNALRYGLLFGVGERLRLIPQIVPEAFIDDLAVPKGGLSLPLL